MNKSEYFTLGRTGLRVSRLALSAMSFGTDGAAAPTKTVHGRSSTAIRNPGNVVDSADLYTNGVSE